MSSAADVDQALHQDLQRRLRFASINGPVPEISTTLPGSTEIGYALRGDRAIVIARREVEIHTGAVRKRHILEVPLAS